MNRMKRLFIAFSVLCVSALLLPFFSATPPAPVFAQAANSLNETFDAGTLPTGWSLSRNNDTTIDWRFDDPGQRTNRTGGSGNFAIIDSDNAGETAIDAELRTPTLDFSGVPSVRLTFRSFFSSLDDTNEQINVNVSNDGGQTWTTVYQSTASQSGLVPVDISAQAANQANVMIAFRYRDANYSWYWQIDEVSVQGISAAAAPSNLNATANGGQIALSWTDTSNDETSFRIERSQTADSGFAEITGTSRDVTSYTDSTGLACNTGYFYRVRARNASGDSAYSNVANATTAACPNATATLNETFDGTSAPTGWTANDLSGGQGTNWGFNDTVLLQFLNRTNDNLASISNGTRTASSLTNAELRTPVLDLSGSPGYLLSFKSFFFSGGGQVAAAVEYSLDGGTTWQTVSTITSNQNATPLRTTQVDMSAGIGGKSNVLIRFRLAGSAIWAIDNVQLTPVTAPATPANLAAISGANGTSSAVITWSPGDANPVSRYDLQRSTDGTNWQDLTTMTNGATSYIDRNVQANTTYSYRIRAVNNVGPSAYSTGVQVTIGGGLGGGTSTSQVFNVTVSYYDTKENAATKRAAIENNLRYFADGVYESSNGVHKIGRVTIYTGGQRADNVDIKWVSRCWPNANISGRATASGRIEHCDTFNRTNFVANDERSQRAGGYTLVHEWGHYTYSLYDEYQSGDPPENPNPGTPLTTDTPVQFSIMNSQWNAVDGTANDWLNFSTSRNNNTNTNAQFRVYGASAWDTLARPVAQDPRDGALKSLSERLYYPNLATVAPVPGEAPSIELPNGQTNARDQLQLVWSPELPGLQSDGTILPAQDAATVPPVVRQVVVDLSSTMSAALLDDVRIVLEEIVDRAEDGDSIGIVGYNDSASVELPLTSINDATIDSIFAALDGLSSGSGEPAMGAALQTALNGITAASPPEGAITAVYLLSTGDFAGTPHPVSLVPDYQEAALPIYTFSLGGTDAGNGTLQQLSEGTNGTFRLANDPNGLSNALERTEQAISPIVDVNIDLDYSLFGADEPVDIAFYVDGTLKDIEVEVLFTGDITSTTFELTNPLAATTPISDCVTDDDEAELETLNICYIALDDVVTGTWQLTGNTTEEEVDLLYWVGSVAARNDTSTFQGYVELPAGELVTYPEPVVVRASVAQQFPVTGIEVLAFVEAPDGSEETFPLADDGVPPDDIAQDGYYTGLLNYTSDGEHWITVYFSNADGNGQFSEYGFEFAPGSDGTTRDQQLTPVGDNFLRFAEAAVNITGMREDDHADWFDEDPTALPLNNEGIAGRIDFADDVDVFAVTVPDGVSGDVVVRIDNMAFEMDPYIYAFAADETWQLEDFLEVEPMADDYLLVTVPVTTAQTFYVEVYHFDETAETGQYRISAGTRLQSETVAAAAATDERTTVSPGDVRVYLPYIRK